MYLDNRKKLSEILNNMAKKKNQNASPEQDTDNGEKSEATAQKAEPEVYEHLIDRLKDEKQHLERDLRYEYRNARRYVRAHPEEGIGLALLTGAAIGFVIGKLTRR